MTTTERADRLAAERRRATAHARARDARNDAAGLCRRCGKAPQSDGTKACATCRERMRISDAKRAPNRPGPATSMRQEWCDECIACGFHRHDCPTRRAA